MEKHTNTHSCPVKLTFSPLTFTTLQHTVLSPRTFPVPVLVQSSRYLFNSFPGRQLLSHDGTENPAGLRTSLHWAEDGGLLILLTNGLQSYCHQILEHGHLAPNEPQWWIPAWKLSFANQICNRLKNRHRLLYLQPTVMVSGLHIQVFYTRFWAPKVPSAASGCELLSQPCNIGLSLLWIIIIGLELRLRLKGWRDQASRGSLGEEGEEQEIDMILVVALWNQDWNHLGERGSVTCGFKHRHRLRSDNITSKQLNL